MIARIALFGTMLALAAGPVAAQSSDLPPGVFMGGKELSEARAGSYAIDPDHSAVLARVQHIGYSWSVFRFDTASGKLGWDPAAPEKSTLSVAVRVESITSNVKGFASELAGEQYLKAAKFPDATFVSTAFRRGDAMHGPNLFIGKVMSLFVSMDRMVGKDFETGLAILKAEAER